MLPTVHYNMGGIPTNYHGEVIRPTKDNPDATVPGLMAIGEAACVSVHGANRLGSNSLLDLVVFGRAAAKRAAELVKPGARHKISPPMPAISRLRASTASATPRAISARRPAARDAEEHAERLRGVPHRRRAGRRRQKIQAVWAKRDRIGVSDRSLIWNSDLVETLELDNLMAQAVATIVRREP